MSVRLMQAALLGATVAAAPAAFALSADSLKDSAGSAMNSMSGSQSSGAGGLLSSLSSNSLSLGSMQNAAGVLAYCQKHGYAESASQRVKQKLIEKVGGPSQAKQSGGYQQGLRGVLQGEKGQTFSLTGLKDKASDGVCRGISDKATSSFIGG